MKTSKYYRFPSDEVPSWVNSTYKDALWRLKVTVWYVRHNGKWEPEISPQPLGSYKRNWKDKFEVTEEEAFLEMV